MLSNRTALLALAAAIAFTCTHSARAATYYDVVSGDNPVGYWRLGETAGATVAQDASGFHRDLDYNNVPASGFFGQPGAIVGDPDTAVKFTPAPPNNPTITSPNTTDFGFASGQSFSAEYWIKALPGNTTAADAGLLTKGYNSTTQALPWYLSQYKSDGRVTWYLRNSASASNVVTSTATVNDGQWHHVVGVYDSSAAQINLYVDGRWQATTAGVPADAYGTNARPLTVANHFNRNVDASMDELAMYDSALSGDQVVEHYATGAGTAVLNVDFGNSLGTGGGPGGRQPGFAEFEGAEGNYNPPVVKTFGLAGAEGTVDVKISGYTHFRDYAAVGGTYAYLSPLLSDMVLRNADGTMKLTLDHLPPGTYQMTTYHHSTAFGGGTLGIRLYDAAAPNQVVADGVPVSSGTNPSSISTETFQFTAGGSSVVIDFLGGAASQHLSLNGFEIELVGPGRPIYKTDVLKVDFNDRGNTGSAFTQAGFDEYVLAGSGGGTRSYGGIDVTLSPNGSSGLDDRLRTEPTNGGAFTQQNLLRDFVFASGDGADNGMNVQIDGLSPNGLYEVTLWSFDDGSGGTQPRRSDWYANGSLVMDDYSFNGNSVPAVQPDSNSLYSFSFLARPDANGILTLQGLAAGGGDPGTAGEPNVFLNALSLSLVRPVPEPSTFALAAVGLLALGFVVRRRRVRA
jgi:hypothetical protein